MAGAPVPSTGSRKTLWVAAAVALTTFLPFLRGVASGQCFYFRDLSRQFFPLRGFAVEGLLKGELRFWNPYLHEGVPLSLPPVSYPLDLLQTLLPNEAGFSLLLALHVPLGAVAFLLLARGLGLSRVAAAGGGIAYALGGFYLSTLNFYVYLQAAAWAPLVVLGLVRSGEGRFRWPPVAALLVAVALSTTGAEIVGQALLIGLVLGLGAGMPRRLLRMGLSIALGFGLVAPTLAVMRGLVAGSARSEGFPTEVVLAQSIHPLTLTQVVVGNFLGDLSNLTNRWWGSRFFPLGFPYVLSLYLGVTLLALAVVGAITGRGPRIRLLALGLLALGVALGRWAGMAVLVDALPFTRLYRHPSKAFFTVHFAVALLAGLGIDALARDGAGRAWRALAALGIGCGGLLFAAQALPVVVPETTRWFLAGFLPPAYSWETRYAVGREILADAAKGGWAAAALGFVGLVVLAGRLAPRRAAVLAVAFVAADLLRTGAGLNPMVTRSFYALSPEMARVAETLRRQGGRLFSCDPESGPEYFRGRALQDDHDVWTFAAFMETLTPAFNVPARVPTALSRDLTMLVPVERVLPPEASGSATLGASLDRLRQAGVSHVVSLESVVDPALRLEASATPPRIAPLVVHVYGLADSLPLRAVAREVVPARDRAAAESTAAEPGFHQRGAVAVEGDVPGTGRAQGRIVSDEETAGRIALQVEADQPSVVVVRDSFAPGWHATVNDAPARILRADGRHRAVAVPAGSSRVVMSYTPPGLPAATGVSLISLAAVAAVWRRRKKSVDSAA